ncbi:lysozyme, partial [Paenibacillus popilliae ATCC 14706]
LWYTASADGLYYLEVGEGTTLHAADGSDMAHAYPATFSEGKLTNTDTCTIPAKERAYFKVDVPGGVAVRFQATEPMLTRQT